jgi:hypothetical protein
MNTSLTITDPLAEAEVTIVVTLPAPAEPAVRDERPALVTVGVAGRPPVSQNGRFADLPHLITTAWTAFGLRAEQEAAAAETEVATVTVDADADHPPPPAAAPPRSPKPQNLSLF